MFEINIISKTPIETYVLFFLILINIYLNILFGQNILHNKTITEKICSLQPQFEQVETTVHGFATSQ